LLFSPAGGEWMQPEQGGKLKIAIFRLAVNILMTDENKNDRPPQERAVMQSRDENG